MSAKDVTSPLLIFDCNYMMHRAFHSRGDLSYEDKASGALFGFFTDVLTIQREFDTDRVAFCFDYGKPKRANILPSYKKTRRDKRKKADEQEKQARRDLVGQITSLRTDLLKRIGYRNIFYQKGYEADDMIAQVVEYGTGCGWMCIMVSSDNDLLQLIAPHCSMYFPTQKKTVEFNDFTARFMVTPGSWAHVKAIAGCSSDDVPGIKGIGEKTACKYLANLLSRGTKSYQKIKEDDWRSRLPLVKLPFEGAKEVHWESDVTTKEDWNRVMRKYGFRTLKDEGPYKTRRKIRGQRKRKRRRVRA